MSPTPIVAAVLVPFVLWRVYNRVRRLMTRQQSHAWRHWTALILLPLLMVVSAWAAMFDPLAMAGMAAGAAAGALLGVLALRKTDFEQNGSELYFTPHAGIGLMVSMLFVGRLLYRAFEFYLHGAAQSQDFARSPLTLLVFGVMAGYYVTYASGLLRWRKRVLPATN